MGLPLILSALHLLSRPRQRAAEDPEKGPQEVTGDEDAEHNDDELDTTENNLDEEDDNSGDDPLTGQQRLHRLGSATSATLFSTTVDSKEATKYHARRQPWYQRCKAYIFPPEESDATLERFVPNYRWTPIISGVVVPFSILLEIPGLTEHWYVRTEANNVVESKSNPPILDVGLAISMACALAANICLLMRFLETRVKTVTLLTIVFLTLHDVINIVAITVFGVQHRFDDGFTYGQSFWLTVCSTVASSITNISVIIDYVRTPEFARSGSGLTRRQRALVIIVIVLLVYIAFGALVNSLIMDLNFVDGLYFTVVTIETIGFGDIHPTNTAQRVFTCCYMAFGIINVGVAVAMTRETVLEGLDLGYRKRLRTLRLRRREAQRFRRWEVRWRRAVEWRLKESGQPLWISDRKYPEEDVRFVGLTSEKDGTGEIHWMKMWLESLGLKRSVGDKRIPHVRGHPSGKHLNIDALSPQQLEAAALEAGVPLEMFLSMPRKPADGADDSERNAKRDEKDKARLRWFHHRQPDTNNWPTSPQTPTHAQIGRMAAMVTKFTIALSGAHVHMLGHAPETQQQMERDATHDAQPQRDNVWFDEHSPQAGGAPANRSGDADPDQDEDVGDAASRHSYGGIVTEGSLLPKVPEWSKDVAHGRKEQFGFVRDRDISDTAKSEERKAYISKLSVAWSLFLLFWFVGSAIFSTTEGWPYGDAMYFCFLAFTTTGYGDFAPASPAGRSVFVVWALMGVATMTILIAVIEEAGSSKYKDALHSKIFDSAVKKYRMRENRETEKLGARARPEVPKTYSDSSLDNATELAQKKAQEELERLPNEILQQARTFHSHMQYFANNAETDWEEAQNPQSANHSRTPRELKSLLNEIAELEPIGERAKRDIMEDDDARNTLLMLSIETNLRRLINAAEHSLGALAERDSLMALKRRREYDRRPSSSKSTHANTEVNTDS